MLFPAPLMPKTVLIVDDSEVLRRTLKTFLKTHAGVEAFEEAIDGKDAIAKVQASAPDLIVLDLAMPRMDGLQAAPLLKRLAPKTHIVLFTMYDYQAPPPQRHIDAIISKVDGMGKLADHVRTFLQVGV